MTHVLQLISAQNYYKDALHNDGHCFSHIKLFTISFTQYLDKVPVHISSSLEEF